MADSKLSALPALTRANLATGDLFYTADASAAASKSMTVDELFGLGVCGRSWTLTGTLATGGAAVVSVANTPAAGVGNSIGLTASPAVGGSLRGGDIPLTPGLKSGSGADGAVIVRQPGGTPGTDEIQVSHNGTRSLLESKDGYIDIITADMAAGRIVQIGGMLGGGVPTIRGITNRLVVDGVLAAQNSTSGLSFDSAAIGTLGAAVWLQLTSGRQRASAGDVTNATVTMANIDGTNLKATLVAGRKYSGILTIFANDSTGADGIQFDFNGGTATATLFQASLVGTPIGATLGVSNSGALATALTATVVSTGDACYVIHFTIVCNAAGTLIPRFAQVAHTTGTATVRATSTMCIEDMPT